MRKQQFYYHVTDVNNVDQIKRVGLKANEEGLIFVFTDMSVSSSIAKEQYGLVDRYAVFKIYSDFLGTFRVDSYESTEWDFLLLKRFKGLTTKDTGKVFEERRKFIKKITRL